MPSRRSKHGGSDEQPVKLVELDALLAAPEGYGDDVPIDPDFHARRLPDSAWRRRLRSPTRSRRSSSCTGCARCSRSSASPASRRSRPTSTASTTATSQRAEPRARPDQWFPAVENRGEGIFIQLDSGAVRMAGARDRRSPRGSTSWPPDTRNGRSDASVQRPFPGGPYVLLHTLSHLLLQSLAMRCGYPASSIRERIYVDYEHGASDCCCTPRAQTPRARSAAS